MPFSFLEPAPSVHPLEDCSCFLLFITWSRELYVRAASAVLNMWQWKLKLDDDKSKHAGFGSAKWFWQPSCTQFIEAAKKAQYSLTPSREECSKYDLTGAPCFCFANHNDWSKQVSISSLSSICSLSFSFMVGVGKK
jgi:hypothetical protein